MRGSRHSMRHMDLQQEICLALTEPPAPSQAAWSDFAVPKSPFPATSKETP
jgi:hypothetical protein